MSRLGVLRRSCLNSPPEVLIRSRAWSGVHSKLPLHATNSIRSSTTNVLEPAPSSAPEICLDLSAPPAQLDPYWFDIVKHFRRSSAISLATQIDPSNAFGYPGLSKFHSSMVQGRPPSALGGLFAGLLSWKQIHPLNLHLVRVGGESISSQILQSIRLYICYVVYYI